MTVQLIYVDDIERQRLDKHREIYYTKDRTTVREQSPRNAFRLTGAVILVLRV